jgi:hypothetical protein
MILNRILYGILITCVVAFQATAQVSLFNKTYDDFNAWEVAGEIWENPDSSLLVLSQSTDIFASDSTKYRIGYFSLLDRDGNTLSKKIIPNPPNSELRYLMPPKLIDGNLFSVVSFFNLDTSADSPRSTAKGFYYTSAGEIIRSFDIKMAVVGNAKPAFGGTFLTSKRNFVTWALYRNIYGDSCYIFSSDSNGNILWLKEHPNLHVSISDIIEMSDGGFILSGKQFQDEKYKLSWDGLELIYIGHPERLWYAKIDSIGNLEWEKLLTGDYYELYDTIYYKYKFATRTSFKTALKTSDGNYVLAGFIENQPYMTKINEHGDRLWQSKYFKNLSYLDTLHRKGYFYSIKEVDGYIYAFGSIDSLDSGASDDTPFDFLMKLTGTGRTIWTRYFRTKSSDYLYNATPSIDGFFLSGSKMDTTPNKYGNQDGWIIKVDKYGCEIPGCHLNDVIDTSTATPEFYRSERSFTLFPNPVSYTLNVQSNLNSQNYTYVIYNCSGQQMFSGKLLASQAISVQSLPLGLYIIELKDDTGLKFRQKFIKQ